MMQFIYLKSHWTPEEADTLLMCLDNLRDTLWQSYGNEIIEYRRQQQVAEYDHGVDIEDDTIPF